MTIQLIFRGIVIGLFLLIPHYFSFSSIRDYHGAIAYSPETGYLGHSGDHYSRRNAEKAALKACRNQAGWLSDCKVIVSYVNGCGALAVCSGGYGSGYGGNKNSAQRRAISSCNRIREENETPCKVVLWSCTSKESFW